MKSLTRRDFFRKAGLLIPATGILPGILFSDTQGANEITRAEASKIAAEFDKIDSLGIFCHDRLVRKQKLSTGPIYVMEGDTLRCRWDVCFDF